MVQHAIHEHSFTALCGVGANGDGTRSVCVCVVAGRWGFGLFHWTALSWANFSNLQTVWAQAQGSVLEANKLFSLLDIHFTSGTVPRALSR